MTKKTLALILAAGRGQRAGKGLPKTYREVKGAPVLRHTALSFINHPQIDCVQIVIHPDDQDLYQDAVGDLKLASPAFGGDTRADSVRNGLKPHQGFDNVLIHDGARPFVRASLISEIVNALNSNPAVIPATPVTDALWRIDGQTVIKPEPRDQFRAAQTPQGFHFELYKSLAKGGAALDDAQTAHENGLDIIWVEGDKENRKLTFATDFEETPAN